jgi:hypothetical protein
MAIMSNSVRYYCKMQAQNEQEKSTITNKTSIRSVVFQHDKPNKQRTPYFNRDYPIVKNFHCNLDYYGYYYHYWGLDERQRMSSLDEILLFRYSYFSFLLGVLCVAPS